MKPRTIKTTGYCISTVSVVLLGVVSWKTASEQPLLLAALIAGMLASISGMVLRWLSYRIEERMEGKP